MSSKDSALYNQRAHKISGGKEISSSTTIAFTSQLSNLINNTTSAKPQLKPTSQRMRRKKDDIFTTHNRNSAKRAKRDLESDETPTFQQKHTTNGESLDAGIWERSKRKMEEKARLYAAMKRGDLEDGEERFAVDFDRKWAAAKEDGKGDISDADDDDDEDGAEEGMEIVEYTDEFGRTRTGTRAQANIAERINQTQQDRASNRSASATGPQNIIHGDTIQHEAFNPDAPIAAQMEALARKRDKSLTPPPDEHFDAKREVRNKGAGFFQFSADSEERRRQMEGLEAERAETEKRRAERELKLGERKVQIEARKEELRRRRGKRKADEFLEELGVELGVRVEDSGTGVTERIEAAVEREAEEIEDQ